ncbi:HAMP domain-containing histidine kinase [bacterium]|nr:HAMP domain-containing histidine kinase [bacterium]
MSATPNDLAAGSPHRCSRMRSLRPRVLGLLAALFVVQLVYVEAVWQPAARAAAEQTTLAQTRSHLQTLGESISTYILQRQYAAIHETFRVLEARHPLWRGLELVDPQGRRLYPLRAPAPTADPGVVAVDCPIANDGALLGTLALRLDLAGATAPQVRQDRYVVLMVMVSSLLAFLVVAAFVDLAVIRPARELQAAARELAAGRRDGALPAAGPDEIGGLVASFAAMRERIAARETDLEAARGEAEEANRAKSRFLATMSHELRTPLNGIIAAASLLERTTLDPRQDRCVGMVGTSADNLLRLITNILDYSEMEAGRVAPVQRPFLPRVVLQEVARQLGPAAAAAGVTLHVAVDHADDLCLLGDAALLQKALLHLGGNAVKFAPGGSVELAARAADTASDTASGTASGGAAPDTRRLEISVRDDGIGMEPDVVDRLFTRFMQAEEGFSRSYGGAGLGLAIAGAIVDLMQGRIRVASAPGQGSTFTLALDLVPAPVPATRAAR